MTLLLSYNCSIIALIPTQIPASASGACLAPKLSFLSSSQASRRVPGRLHSPQVVPVGPRWSKVVRGRPSCFRVSTGRPIPSQVVLWRPLCVERCKLRPRASALLNSTSDHLIYLWSVVCVSKESWLRWFIWAQVRKSR